MGMWLDLGTQPLRRKLGSVFNPPLPKGCFDTRSSNHLYQVTSNDEWIIKDIICIERVLHQVFKRHIWRPSNCFIFMLCWNSRCQRKFTSYTDISHVYSSLFSSKKLFVWKGLIPWSKKSDSINTHLFIIFSATPKTYVSIILSFALKLIIHVQYHNKRECRPKSFYLNCHSQGFRPNLLVKNTTYRKVVLNGFPICMVVGFHPPTQNYRTALYSVLISTEEKTGKDLLGRLHLNAAGYCNLNLIHEYTQMLEQTCTT